MVNINFGRQPELIDPIKLSVLPAPEKDDNHDSDNRSGSDLKAFEKDMRKQGKGVTLENFSAWRREREELSVVDLVRVVRKIEIEERINRVKKLSNN